MRLPQAALAFGLLLAACGEPAPEQQPTPDGTALEAAPAPQLPSPDEQLALDSRDCRTVARAYLDAVATENFDFAARFWDDPVIDGARLQALFAGYGQASIAISDVAEEGAAGSLYCTVTGTLTDIADPAKAPLEGQLVLRRANDVPGASERQLRWTIRSSTFVEPIEQSNRADPA